MASVALVLALFVASLLAQNPDPCSPHPDCDSCVHDTHHVCGWCSTRVSYKNGLQGAQCVSNDGSYPFACYGTFSTEDCQIGYVCNPTTNQCEEGQPGQGLPYQQCVAQCGPAPTPPTPPTPPSPPADTYACNETTYQCYKTAPGRGSSKYVCLQTCQPIPPTVPVAPTPPTPPAATYLCNQTTLQCYKVPPGHGASYEICATACVAAGKYACNFTTYQCEAVQSGGTDKDTCDKSCIPLYTCDDSTHTCVVAPYPQPGIPQADCEKHCKPSNSTPSDLIGLWRGLQVNHGFQSGEWDFEFKNATLTAVGPAGMGLAGATTFYGTPDRMLFTLTVAKSSVSIYNVGATVEFWFAFDGSSPETRFLMVASGPANGKAPTSWSHSEGSSSGMEWGFIECQILTSCQFRMQNLSHTASFHTHDKYALMTVSEQVAINDPCSTNPSCAQCLASPKCGWCSVDVIYKDGSKGAHCAGWGPDGSRNQFKCSGIYRTDDCNDYECVMPQGECVKVPLGGGRSKEDCETNCHATPNPPSPPSPGPSPQPAQTYACNSTNATCFPTTIGHGTSLYLCELNCGHTVPAVPVAPTPPTPPTPPAPTFICNQTTYTCDRTVPGHGASLEICQVDCAAPPAPAHLTGTWRGLQIDNQYHSGEFVLKLTQDSKNQVSFTLALDGTTVQSGTVWSNNLKNGGLTINVNQPDGSVQQLVAIYSQDQGVLLEQITLVIGGNDHDVPSGWDTPWVLGGENGSEFVFIRDKTSNINKQSNHP